MNRHNLIVLLGCMECVGAVLGEKEGKVTLEQAYYQPLKASILCMPSPRH